MAVGGVLAILGAFVLYCGYIALLQFIFARNISRQRGKRLFFILSLVLTLAIIYVPGILQIRIPAIKGLDEGLALTMLLAITPLLSVLFLKLVLRQRKERISK